MTPPATDVRILNLKPPQLFVPAPTTPFLSRHKRHPNTQLNSHQHKHHIQPTRPTARSTPPRPELQRTNQKTSNLMMHILRVAQFLTYGYLNFGKRGYEAHAKNFNKNALNVDLQGRHIIVTGATSGLGRVTAQALASKNATVHLVCRDGTRGRAVQASIQTTYPRASVQVHECDLSSLQDITELADHFKNNEVPINALVNNAGSMIHKVESSKEGFEKSFATNTLGVFALTEMLRPVLQGQRDARVITVSSGGMLTEELQVDDAEGEALRDGKGGIDGAAQYARCKRMQVAMTEFWAREYEKSGIFWATMHPGWAGTPGLEKSMPDFYKFTKEQLRSQEEGADTIVYLTIAEEVSEFPSGEFFFDRNPSVKHLWLGGTQYGLEDVDRMMKRFRAFVTDKGFSLPE